MGVKDEILKAQKTFERDARAIARYGALKVFVDVVQNTPVDTGRAKSNWFVSTGAPSKNVVVDTASFASSTEQRISEIDSKVSNWKPTDRAIFLTNNLPYIRRLEFDGWSSQKPTGWVRQAASRFNKFIEEATAANRAKNLRRRGSRKSKI